MNNGRKSVNALPVRLLLLLGLVIAVGALVASQGSLAHANANTAQTYAVTDCISYAGTSSGAAGSLQYAITNANTNNEGDIISFQCAGSGNVTFLLPSTITISGSLTMQYQSGKHVILTDEDADEQVISVNSGVTFTLDGLTITGGEATNGGGLANNGGTVNIDHSTFTNNTASVGGAIYQNGGTLTITDSTFTGNTASSNGGAIVNNAGVTSIDSSTIVGNGVTAVYGPAGGLEKNSGTLSVGNSIVADNTSNYGSGTYLWDCNGNISDNSYNIESGIDCNFVRQSDHQNVPDNMLLLGSLADKGGPTQTMALLDGSIAINQGGNTCPADDQRGIERIQGPHCDIGAFEYRVPTISGVSSDITLNVNATHTVVTWATPTGTEPDSADLPHISCSPASGSTFYAGTTQVTCSASDNADPVDVTTQSFAVIVNDTLDVPSINVPGTQWINATTAQGGTLTYSVTASDPIYPTNQLAVSCVNHDNNSITYPTGSNVSAFFNDGWTTVDCTVVNPFTHTSATSAFAVAVQDVPTMNVPSDITVDATSGSGNVVSYEVSAQDPGFVSGQLTIRCSPDSGSTFPIGTTQVNCTVHNPDNNSDGKSFNVIVRDIPQITVPDTITTNATSVNGASVSYTVGASDTYFSGGQLTTSCSVGGDDIGYPAAYTFPIGTTQVDCTVTNPGNFTASNSFNVTVQDNQPPQIHVPNHITVSATSKHGAVVSYHVTASDPIYPANRLTISCQTHSGSTFAIGTSTVHCTVTNPSGKHVSGSFQITVLNASQQISALMQNVESFNISDYQQDQLEYQLNLALAALKANRPALAHNYLHSFLSLMNGMHKSLKNSQYTKATNDAYRIMTVLGFS